jgi:SAM-dependent methyltransferase
MANPLSRFLEWNRRLSQGLDARLPRDRRDLFARYRELVRGELSRRPGALVLDLGGGNLCEFLAPGERLAGERLIVIDLGIDGLQVNKTARYGVAADLTVGIPLADSIVDVVASSRFLEHLPVVSVVLRESYRVLKPGGVCIHVLPSRNAPFAVIKRMLPHPVSSALVRRLHAPVSAGFCWSPLFYDRCTARGLARIMTQAGFERITTEVCYGQAQHFAPLAPLYLLNVFYEWIVAGLHARGLAAYVLIVGYKPK